MRVLVPSWFSTTTELANTTGLVVVIPSPSLGQVGLLEGLTREPSALCLPSHKSAAWAGQGGFFGLWLPPSCSCTFGATGC